MPQRTGALMQRKFREYLFPTVLTAMALSLSNVLSGILVGNYLGETALSAMGVAAPVVYCFNAILFVFSSGGVASAAIAMGRREQRDANRVYTLTLMMGMLAMALFTAVVLLFLKPITLGLARGDEALAALTAQYLAPLAFVGPAMMFTMGMSPFVRIDGSPKATAIVVLVANGVNLALLVLLVHVAGLGLAGAGLSMPLGFLAGGAVLLPLMLAKKRTLRLARLQKGDFARLKGILRVGAPKGMMQGFSFLRALVLNALIIGALGSPGMAALTVCNNALMLTAMFISGTNDTAIPIAGTLYGERDYAGIRYTVRAALRVLLAATVAMMLLFLLFPAAVGRLFGITSPEGLAVVGPALRLYALCLPMYGLNQLLQSLFSTTGREKLSMLIVSLDSFALVCAFAVLFARVNADLIWLAFACSELGTLLVVALASRRIRKKENVKGALLLREDKDAGPALDVTIPATVEAAVGLSVRVADFCRQNGASSAAANKLALAAEEMAVNTARFGHPGKQGAIDVLVRCGEADMLLRLRDDGTPFDPTVYTPEERQTIAVGGIEVVRRVASDISYARQLGFNVTIVTVPAARLAGQVP